MLYKYDKKIKIKIEFHLHRYEPSIDTVHQLAEKNMEWGATHDAWIFSIQSATKVCVYI